MGRGQLAAEDGRTEEAARWFNAARPGPRKAKGAEDTRPRVRVVRVNHETKTITVETDAT